MSAASIRIEIVYAEPHRAIVKAMSVAAGSCIADALRLAALDSDFNGVNLVSSALGVFGRAAGREYVLQEGDRIEIYRPLAADPKAARRSRVQQARKKAAR